MVDRNAFAELLNSVQINSMDDSETVKAKLSQIGKWIQANTPRQLFRYRTVSENSISALENDQVWGSSIVTFNDPYECIPYYDRDKVMRNFQFGFSAEVIKRIAEMITSDGIPTLLKGMFPDEFWNATKENLQNTQPEEIQRTVSQNQQNALQYVQDNWQRIADDALVAMREHESMRHVACFSEKNDSYLMWSHYANVHTGFCIQYDFTSVLGPCAGNCQDAHGCHAFGLSCPIQPVIYSPKRYDATDYIAVVMQQEFSRRMGIPMKDYYFIDTLLAAKCLLYKSTNWEYEKEWRLVTPVHNITNFHSCMMTMKPTGVYLGSRMKQDDIHRIWSICKSKEIPCYKMVHTYSESEYHLRYYEYNDEIQ